MTHDKTIESPLAQMKKTGKIGAKAPTTTITEPTTSASSEQSTPERKVKKAHDSQREKLQVYVSPDLVKWVKHQAVDQRLEISEVVEEALQQYRDKLLQN